MNNPFGGSGLLHFWNQGDSVSHALSLVLLAMSILSWFFILSKGLTAWRARQAARVLGGFWQTQSLQDGHQLLAQADDEAIFAPLAAQALALQQRPAEGSLAAKLSGEELATRLLREQIHIATRKLERGLTLLASIGATAPFVGLLGTVWGIYHSLSAVSHAGMAQIDKLAGPVGEALIMTALGLAVAIPAVLAYNGFARLNRITLAELDGFAHDLLAALKRLS
ncbi:MotA/TolQ/ExbB proton channel family protein [Massilia sp. W12]|uniref:MotA/TolQ/ExbB proton channel family protein n=1 Tax=Massilia sp. W12 TaxID=3126507 RepID=UPI0030D526CB